MSDPVAQPSDAAPSSTEPQAPEVAQVGESQPAIESSPEPSSQPSLPMPPTASTENSVSADLPNAADTPRVGIVTAASTGDAIRPHLAAIKQILSDRGFEQSSVADITNELDQIEALL